MRCRKDVSHIDFFVCVEAQISLTKAVCVEVLSNDATTQSSTLAFSQSEDKLLHTYA